MSRHFDGDNDYLRVASAVFDASTLETTPASVLIWFKRDRSAVGDEETLMCMSAGTASNNLCEIVFTTADRVGVRTRTSSNSHALSTVLTDTASWHMAVGVYGDTSTGAATTSSRSVYLDGAAASTEPTAKDPTSASTQLTFGGNEASTPTQDFQGYMAYLTVWNKALSSSEVASLYNSGAGADPLTVANGNIIAYWPLTGNESPEIDQVGAFDLTVTGTTFSSDNPFTLAADDYTLPVDVGYGVAEASNINFQAPDSLTLPVTNGNVAAEGQDIYFQMTSLAADVSMVVAGQDILFGFSEPFSLSVDVGTAVAAGETITLNQNFSLTVDTGFGVAEGYDISSFTPFVTAAARAGARKRAARRMINFRR